MKSDSTRDLFLAQLRKVPIVQVVCEKVGISRSAVYNWRRNDEKFRQAMEEALAEGEDLINDMSESQLLTLIREKSLPAILFWLRKRSPRFRDRVEIDANIRSQQDRLTPEQEACVKAALKLASLPVEPPDEAAAAANTQDHDPGSDPI